MQTLILIVKILMTMYTSSLMVTMLAQYIKEEDTLWLKLWTIVYHGTLLVLIWK